MGIELPVFYNAWSRPPNFTIGLETYVPIRADQGRNAGTAHRAGIGLTIGYRISR